MSHLAISPDAKFTVSVTISLFILGGIAACFGYVVKGAARWTRTEQRLENLVEDVQRLVADKDSVHKEIVGTLREDRKVTDRRLRWLEETLWKAPKQ